MMTEVKGQSRGSESNGTENLLCTPARGPEDCSGPHPQLQPLSTGGQLPPGKQDKKMDQAETLKLSDNQKKRSYLLSSFGSNLMGIQEDIIN